jgi:dihydropteroate synthase
MFTPLLFFVLILSVVFPAALGLWEARGHLVVGNDCRPCVMGVVNATPDSFSEQGGTFAPADAVARGLRLVHAGAAILDIGGESSRPGAKPVGVEEELRRVLPVLEQLAAERVPLSIDTTKANVARAAIAAGATIVNDITALRGDPSMAGVVAETGAGVVLMHMQGTPETMQRNPQYADVVAEVFEFLRERVAWAESRGIPRVRIAVDPGIGFGKTFDHNLSLLRNLQRFTDLGCTLAVGTSRKGFLGFLTGRKVTKRRSASVVSSLLAIERGARVVRVHDVASMVDAIKVWEALKGWKDAP